MPRERVKMLRPVAPVPDEDLPGYRELFGAHKRDDFWEYRKALNPDMVLGWWIKAAARELEQFYKDFREGKRPILLLQAPPQHGKSFMVVDFISWITGLNPNLKVIFASYADDLGMRSNRALQRIYTSDVFQAIFPKLQVQATSAKELVESRQTLSLIEFVGSAGNFRNTTISGRVTGHGLDFGVIDDPVKDHATANNELNRNKIWDWLTDDFMPRFSDQAALMLIMTRRHLDDPAGRLMEKFPRAKVVKFKAIADDEPAVVADKRLKGEALFPEYKSIEFLKERRRAMTQGGWEAEYQQSPIIVGGNMFPVRMFTIVPVNERPHMSKIRRVVRYWDKAGTHGAGAYTAGVRMEELRDGRYIVTDVRRAQLGAFEREELIKNIAHMDNADRPVDTWVEQEPGSGGKESAERTVTNLAGYSIRKDRVRGDKELRAEPYAAQVQGGNVMLLQAEWNLPFLNEHEAFPNGKFKDQVDAASGAFSRLTSRRFEGDNLDRVPSLPVVFDGDVKVFG